MSIRYFFSILAASFMVAILGCGSTMFYPDSTLDKNWGRSFESAKYNQILNPGAAKNNKPVTGLDGQAGEINMGAYRDSFAGDTPSPDYNINLSGIGGIGGGR